MKNNIYKLIRIFLFTGIFIMTVQNLFSAPPPPDGGCWPPSTCIPIDGGISFLIAAGLIFGTKKALDIKKK